MPIEHLNNTINTPINDNKFVLAVQTDLTKTFYMVDYNIVASGT